MIDSLDTAASRAHFVPPDEAATIRGNVLKAEPDNSWVSRLMAPAGNASGAHARALDHLTRAENPEFAHLYVEIVVAHRGLGAYGGAIRAARGSRRRRQTILTLSSGGTPL